MKKKIWIVLGILLVVVLGVGLLLYYKNRSMNHESSDVIEIEYDGQKFLVTDPKEIELIETIVRSLEYKGELCYGITTHKITIQNEVYFLKEDCQEIQWNEKQAKISVKDIEKIRQILASKTNKTQMYSKNLGEMILSLNIPNDWNYEELTPEKDSDIQFALKLYKNSSDHYMMLYFYKRLFGVCGTGRRTKKVNLDNGTEAVIGSYDDSNEWSDISFYELNPNVAFINYGIQEDFNEILQFVKTFDIKPLNP